MVFLSFRLVFLSCHIVILIQHVVKFTHGLTEKFRNVNCSEYIGLVPLLASVLVGHLIIVLMVAHSLEDLVIGLDKELIFEIVGGKVILSFANPVVQNLKIWLETNQKTLLEDVELVASSLLKVINQQLVHLYLHVEEVKQVSRSVCWFDMLTVQRGTWKTTGIIDIIHKFSVTLEALFKLLSLVWHVRMVIILWCTILSLVVSEV